MKKIVILLLIGFQCFAQTKSLKVSATLKENSAESVGMSSERLKRIEDMILEAVKSENIPGATILPSATAT